MATNTSPTTATYTVDAASLEVAVVTSAPCWIELRDRSAVGAVIYEGTLQAGASQSFPYAGPMWMRLGDPSGVRLSIDGSPVTLPAAGSPFDVTVIPA